MYRILFILIFILISSGISAQDTAASERLYGPTTNQDHIWQLAKTLRPNDTISVQQMIIALQQANPDAFDQKNINSLKHGQMLHVPSLTKITAISSAAAAKLVAQQNQEWQKLQTPPVPVNTAPPLLQKLAPEPVINLPAPIVRNSKNVTNNQSIQEQLIATQEDLKTYKRQAAESFIILQQQNLSVQSQLLRLNQTLAALTQQVLNVRTEFAAQAKNLESPNYLSSLITILPKNRAAWWIIGITALLLILIWFPWSTEDTKVQRRTSAIVGDPDLDEEYDFMNSQEAIPAKLNLARAYIDMDDFPAATKVLEEVIRKGNKAEQQQARQLLNAIKLG